VKPWAGYVRVSFVGERGGDSFRSPEDQAATIQAWANARNEPVQILTPELDRSGGDTNRPILNQAIEGIEQGQYRGLVVAYLSRASRSVSHLLKTWDRIEQAGGEVVAVNENIDTSTPAGRLTRTMLAAIAEHELDLYRERFEELRASATQRGIWQRRQTPRGYDRDPQTRRLTPNQDAELIRQTFRDFANGAATGTLSERLQMTPSGVRNLLRNRVYLGELRVGQHTNPEAHPPIVTEAEFNAAQTRDGTSKPRPNRPPSLLAGIIRCAGCGHVMIKATSEKGRYVYYRCRKRHSAGSCEAPAAIDLAKTDALVEKIALNEMRRFAAQRANNTQTVNAARETLAHAETELGTYLQAVSAADVGADRFNEGATIRRQAVDKARAELDALAGTNRTETKRLVTEWPKLSANHKNALLRSLLEVVLVRPGREPINDRIQIVAHGAGIIQPYRGGGVPRPNEPVAFLNETDPRVLRL
jgi:DNA invertase Pin-like site-specific DNA recombinase